MIHHPIALPPPWGLSVSLYQPSLHSQYTSDQSHKEATSATLPASVSPFNSASLSTGVCPHWFRPATSSQTQYTPLQVPYTAQCPTQPVPVPELPRLVHDSQREFADLKMAWTFCPIRTLNFLNISKMCAYGTLGSGQSQANSCLADIMYNPTSPPCRLCRDSTGSCISWHKVRLQPS